MVSESQQMACGNCRYFVRDKSELQDGQCRASPPSGNGASGFPIVHETDWCGLFSCGKICIAVDDLPAFVVKIRKAATYLNKEGSLVLIKKLLRGEKTGIPSLDNE